MPSTDQIIKAFPHEPTAQQLELFGKLHEFLLSDNGDECLILKGYAGTGKTTVLGALVKALKYYNYKSVLLAPTGRAAKVITNYSGRKAFTIHKRIYRKKSAMNIDDGFRLADNLATDTIFIVDEASMISDESAGNMRETLLHDLVSYVYNTKNCKLMLVGDTAQLPPVGADNSPALDLKLMKSVFALDIFSFELTDVLRQQKDSGDAVRHCCSLAEKHSVPEPPPRLPFGLLTKLQDECGASQNDSDGHQFQSEGSIRLARSQSEGACKQNAQQ